MDGFWLGHFIDNTTTVILQCSYKCSRRRAGSEEMPWHARLHYFRKCWYFEVMHAVFVVLCWIAKGIAHQTSISILVNVQNMITHR